MMDRLFPFLAAPAAAALAFLLGTGPFIEGPGPLLRAHFVAGVGTAVFLCALHTVIMFHFIGTGADIREAAALLGSDAGPVREARRFKARVFPLATISMLAIIAGEMLGGGADMKAVSGPVHGVVATAASALNLYTLAVQYGALRANSRLLRSLEERVRELATPSYLRVRS
jgi:hypothetical protein